MRSNITGGCGRWGRAWNKRPGCLPIFQMSFSVAIETIKELRLLFCCPHFWSRGYDTHFLCWKCEEWVAVLLQKIVDSCILFIVIILRDTWILLHNNQFYQNLILSHYKKIFNAIYRQFSWFPVHKPGSNSNVVRAATPPVLKPVIWLTCIAKNDSRSDIVLLFHMVNCWFVW